MKKFRKVLCPCGCGRSFPLNTDEPCEYEITQYTFEKNPRPLEVKRLPDGMTFRLGETIKRKSKTGRAYPRFILYDIIVTEHCGLLLWGYVVDRLGTVRIDNDKLYMKNASNPNIFRYLYK